MLLAYAAKLRGAYGYYRVGGRKLRGGMQWTGAEPALCTADTGIHTAPSPLRLLRPLNRHYWRSLMDSSGAALNHKPPTER